MAEKVRIPWFLRSGWRLLGTLATFLLLPLALLAFLVVSKSRETLRDEARLQNERAALLAARVVNDRFERLVEVTEAFADRPLLAKRVTDGDSAGVRDHLGPLVRNSEIIDRAFITDPSGVERYDFPHVPEVIGQDFSHRDWFEGVSGAGDTYVSEVYRRTAAPRRHLVAVATPIRDGAGDLLGYLVVQHTIHDLTSWLGSLLPEKTGRILLFGREGRAAVAETPSGAPPEASGPILETANAATSVGSREAADPLSGKASLLSYAPTELLGGFVLVGRPLREVLAPARALERWIYGLSALVAVAMVLLGFAWLNFARRQHVALAELHRQKDLLTSMLVHDLRNPLTAAMSYASMVRSAAPEESQRDVLQVESSLLRMRGLLDNILEVVKLEEGDLPVKREKTDLARLLEDTARAYEGPAELAGVELACAPLPEVEADIDPSMTARITENLLTNALKHTPSGGQVTLSLRREGDELRITVVDTGEGFSKESLPKLFQKYGRLEDQEHAHRSDTGFGLLFCRMAAEAQGGSIRAESEQGEGATFVVSLPA